MNKLRRLQRRAAWMLMACGVSIGQQTMAHDAEQGSRGCRSLTADRVFDGNELYKAAAVLIRGDRIVRVGGQADLRALCEQVIDLGDAPILPGFIESHAHLAYQKVDRH